VLARAGAAPRTGAWSALAPARLPLSVIVDIVSSMLDTAPGVNQRIAARVRELRAVRGLSLAGLAARSGVSRSMISLIERGECSPTAVVLDRLAAGLGVVLASLFEARPSGVPGDTGPVARREAQPEWRDPASGYVRRSISPPSADQPVRIVEIHFPPGRRVAFDTGARDGTIHQQVWVLEGAIDVTAGAERHRLRAGDCLAMRLDGPTSFHNFTRAPARYAVVTATQTMPRAR